MLMIFKYCFTDYKEINKIYYKIITPKLFNGIFAKDFIYMLFTKTTIQVFVDDILIDKKDIYGQHRTIYKQMKNINHKINDETYLVDLYDCSGLDYLEEWVNPYSIIIDVEINTDIDLDKITTYKSDQKPFLSGNFIVYEVYKNWKQYYQN